MQQARAGRLSSLFARAGNSNANSNNNNNGSNNANNNQQQPPACTYSTILAFIWRLLWLATGGYASFWIMRKIFGKGYSSSNSPQSPNRSFFDDLFEVCLSTKQ